MKNLIKYEEKNSFPFLKKDDYQKLSLLKKENENIEIIQLLKQFSFFKNNHDPIFYFIFTRVNFTKEDLEKLLFINQHLFNELDKKTDNNNYYSFKLSNHYLIEMDNDVLVINTPNEQFIFERKLNTGSKIGEYYQILDKMFNNGYYSSSKIKINDINKLNNSYYKKYNKWFPRKTTVKLDNEVIHNYYDAFIFICIFETFFDKFYSLKEQNKFLPDDLIAHSKTIQVKENLDDFNNEW